MPIDWEAFEREIDDEIAAAADRTNERLASQMSSLTRLTDEEIQELFPKPADLKNLTRLMEIVKSAEDDNIRITRLVENVEDLAGTALTLLERLA